MLFLDLDGFKEVNDSLGHASGDLLLVAGRRAAARLRARRDTVARLGGDEFALLVEDSRRRDAERSPQRITDALDEPFSIDGQELHVRGSSRHRDADRDVDAPTSCCATPTSRSNWRGVVWFNFFFLVMPHFQACANGRP